MNRSSGPATPAGGEVLSSRFTFTAIVTVGRSGVSVIAFAAIFFLFGLLFVRFDTGIETPLVSAAFIILLALPAYIALIRWLGAGCGLAVIGMITVLPLLVEAFAVATGVPYGAFSYSSDLGYRLFGLVPWSVAFAYPPILLGALTIGSAVGSSRRGVVVAASAVLVVAFDLVVDPAAVLAGFWSWDEPGVYYGIPLVNFAGWLLTGALYAALVTLVIGDRIIASGGIPVSVAHSSLLITAFWTGYLVRNGLWIPAGIGGVLILVLLHLMRRDRSAR